MPLRGVVHPEVVTDSPDDDLARIETHPHSDIESGLAPHVRGERPQLARHLERRRAGALGVILVGDRCPEERHDAVAGVLVDGSLVAVDAVSEDPEEAIEETMPFLGIDALGELHGLCDVGEEDGDRLALALERALVRKDLLDEVARRVGARVRGGGERGQPRAAVVAELRRGGIVVSAGWAGHHAHLSPEIERRQARSPCDSSRLISQSA